MNKLICLIFFTFSAYSADFDGYIIKFKNGQSAKSLKNKLGPETTDLNLSFGNYSLWKPSNKSLIHEIENDPNVEYIEPNFYMKNIGIAGEEVSPEILDELFGEQWALVNTGKNGGNIMFEKPVEGIDINAIGAWKITKGSKDVVIAVLDGGVLYKHPDLIDNMWINETEANGVEGFDDDGNGLIDDIHGFVDPGNKFPFPTDTSGHGTHVAGIIGMTHNTIGGRGVMGEVSIMPLNAKEDRTFEFPLASILKAIDYAINKKATIITTSLGGDDYSKSYEEAIQRAIQNGIPFICACGNSKDNLDKKKIYPPRYVDKIKELIVVCAHGPSGRKNSQSNYGKNSVAILAPGSSIYSTTVSLYPGPDGFKGPSYGKLSGTSMAAPFVAGAIGLLYSIEPHLTPAQVKERLIKTAKKEELLEKYSTSGGRLDLVRLLKNIEN